MSAIITTICGLVGVAGRLYIVIKARDTVLLFTRPSRLPRYLHRGVQKAEPWALVSGASDGIGFGFCKELGRNGFNVILHGRNEAKLNRCKDQLRKDNPQRDFLILAVDTTDPKAVPKIESFVADMKREQVHLTVLINNVGGAGSMRAWQSLASRTGNDVDDFLAINARFPTQLTRTMLPVLENSSPSLIVNIGSFTGDLASPYLTVYSGCKAFNLAFSKSLAAEMTAEGKDVEVLGVMVGPVGDEVGRGGAVKGLEFFTPTFAEMAKAALARVGCGRSIVTTYWAHSLMKWPMDFMPEWLSEMIAIRIAKQKDTKAAKEQ